MAGRSSIIDANVGLTFDDVLLLPGRSEVLPGETDVASRVTSLLQSPLFHRLRSGHPQATPPRGLSPRPAAVTFDCWNTLLYEGDWQTAHALHHAGQSRQRGSWRTSPSRMRPTAVRASSAARPTCPQNASSSR